MRRGREGVGRGRVSGRVERAVVGADPRTERRVCEGERESPQADVPGSPVVANATHLVPTSLAVASSPLTSRALPSEPFAASPSHRLRELNTHGRSIEWNAPSWAPAGWARIDEGPVRRR